jgi:hypothetical protein
MKYFSIVFFLLIPLYIFACTQAKSQDHFLTNKKNSSNNLGPKLKAAPISINDSIMLAGKFVHNHINDTLKQLNPQAYALAMQYIQEDNEHQYRLISHVSLGIGTIGAIGVGGCIGVGIVVSPPDTSQIANVTKQLFAGSLVTAAISIPIGLLFESYDAPYVVDFDNGLHTLVRDREAAIVSGYSHSTHGAHHSGGSHWGAGHGYGGGHSSGHPAGGHSSGHSSGHAGGHGR